MPDRDRRLVMMPVPRNVRPSGGLWNPPADVYRTSSGWTVKLDLAGICIEELEVQASGSDLRVRGSRRDTFFQEGFRYQQMEITYSRFEKVIQFPCPIHPSSLERDYRDGWLLIHLHCEE